MIPRSSQQELILVLGFEPQDPHTKISSTNGAGWYLGRSIVLWNSVHVENVSP